MKNFFLALTTSCLLLAAQGQHSRSATSQVYSSLTTYSNRYCDAFALRNNVAAIAGTGQFSAGLFSERRFLLKELSSYSLAALLPTHSGNFGLKANTFGDGLLRETGFGLGYARMLGEKLAIGTSFNYYSLAASGYGSASLLTFDAGLMMPITESLRVGLSAHNPVGMKWGKTGERMPMVFSAGLGHDVSTQLFIGAEVEKTEDAPTTINAGLQYVFAEKLIARGGISSGTTACYLGFGVQLKSLRLDATATFHPYLGVTPGLLLLYSPKP